MGNVSFPDISVNDSVSLYVAKGIDKLKKNIIQSEIFKRLEVIANKTTRVSIKRSKHGFRSTACLSIFSKRRRYPVRADFLPYWYIF